MKTLAVTSGKGGVGKTTLTLNIARQLSSHGLRTLVMDLDIHNKGITSLFLHKVEDDSSSVTGIVHQAGSFDLSRVETVVAESKLLPMDTAGKLFLLPAAKPREMIRWENFHAPNDQIVDFLRQLIWRLALKHGVDVVVMDCYGGIDSLTVAAIGAADDAVIVNEPDVVTFSGTLLLYSYLGKEYEQCDRKPRIHFVINRITSRHSFRFLDTEYKKHLAPLAIDKKILAYFPYDKLLMETFGDYPFFSELLPKGLFTCKIRLLIARLWGNEERFSNFADISKRKQKRIFEKTKETPFADPERIIRAIVTLPLWVVLPGIILFLLSVGFGSSLPYTIIWQAYYFSVALLLFLVVVLGFFEPIQITRWLLRSAKYHRRKRMLKGEGGKLYRFLNSFAEAFRAVLPASFGVVFLVLISMKPITIIGKNTLRDVSIWPGEIYGFSAGGHYEGLRMGRSATIKRGSNLQGAHFNEARLSETRLVGLDFRHADFSGALLIDTRFDESILQYANFDRARLGHTSFQQADLTGAKIAGAVLTDRVDFTDAILKNANVSGLPLRGQQLADLESKGAILDESQKQKVKVEAEGLGPYQECVTLKCAIEQATRMIRDAPSYSPRYSVGRVNLVEALIVRGGPVDFEVADRLLEELKQADTPDPISGEGRYLLLRLILTIVTGTDDSAAGRAWCGWIGEHELPGWSWKLWDQNFPQQRYNDLQKQKLISIKLSSMGEPNSTDQLCSRFYGGASRGEKYGRRPIHPLK